MAVQWQQVRWGMVLCVVTVLYSFVLGAAMGGQEALFKDHFKQTVQINAIQVFGDDNAKMDRAKERAWTYTKRSHMHAAGVGIIGLALMLMIPLVTSSRLFQHGLSLAYGLGSLAYPLTWLIAGFRVPTMGTTSAAKASIEWLAMPSVFLLVASTTVILILLLRWGLSKEKPYS